RVFHVFTGATVTISGLTVRNGYVSGDADLTSTGGGIRNSGTLMLTDCAVTGNTASDSGGGIYNVAGKTLAVSNCTFSANSAFEGGAIFNEATFNGTTGATVTVTNSAFNGNAAGIGAAIANNDSVSATAPATLTVSGSTFSHNVAAERRGLKVVVFAGVGGAIANGGTATVIDSTLSENQAQDSAD